MQQLIKLPLEELGHFPEMQMGESPPPGALISAASRAATIAFRALGVAAKSGSAGDALIAQEAIALSSANNKLVDSRLPRNPDDLLKDSFWIETTHPDALESGHRTFVNKSTGEKLRFDKGQPDQPGIEAKIIGIG